MKTFIRTAIASAVLAGASGAVLAFDLNGPLATTTGSATPLTAGNSFTSMLTTDGSVSELFTFFWSGVDAFVQISSSASPGGSYDFGAWSFGSCGGVGCAIQSIIASGTGPVAGPIGYSTPGTLMAGDYFWTFAGTDNSTTNSIMTNLAINADMPVMTPVPEPSTYALMLAGLGVVGYMARRRKVVGGQAKLVAA